MPRPNAIELHTMEIFRKAHLRSTPARTIVLNRLLQVGKPLSLEALTDLEPELDRVTIYRTLERLFQHGIVHRVQGVDRRWHYCAHDTEAEGCGGNHAHFLCQDCGEMICLTGQPLPWLATPEGAEVLGKQFVIYGRCAKCSAIAKKAKPSSGTTNDDF